jgi:hypothetical protein
MSYTSTETKALTVDQMLLQIPTFLIAGEYDVLLFPSNAQSVF